MRRIDLTLRPARGRPKCVGVGFVALDVVDSDSEPFAAAGGSCGNVMAILAWMGWNSQPVARVGNDWAGKLLADDLKRSGVNTGALLIQDEVKTPIVIQRFVEHDSGQRSHRFSLTCPGCGAWLPRHRPLTKAQVANLRGALEGTKVFYFDRVSPGSINLARCAKEAGALVVFEPSSIGDENQFQKAVDACDVLKFSHDRLGHVSDLAQAAAPRIIIETLGADGLRFRLRSRWTHLPAFKTPRLRDAAGSGDWCSAGFIHFLAQQGDPSLLNAYKTNIEMALRFGQALAAVNCAFDGARGAMLALAREQMSTILEKLKGPEGGDLVSHEADEPSGLRKVHVQLCGLCSPEYGAGCKAEQNRQVA